MFNHETHSVFTTEVNKQLSTKNMKENRMIDLATILQGPVQKSGQGACKNVGEARATTLLFSSRWLRAPGKRVSISCMHSTA